MDKVTIIMPVYNGEKFLKDSVGTIFGQTYGNIELIAIDDGSRDHSFELLETLRDQAPSNISMNIRRQENSGICRTRNAALELADGKYICFMDQDDFLNADCIEKLVGTMEARQADLVIGGYDLVDENRKILDQWTLNEDLPWCKFRISAPWGRMFRKDIIDRHHIRFMVTKISEDFYFNLVYMSYCSNIAVTSYRGYQWRYSAQSESHANMSVPSKDRDPLIMMSRVLHDMNPDHILEKDLLEYMFVKHIVWYLFYTARASSKEMIRRNYSRCFKWLNRFFPAYMKNPQIRFSKPAGEAFKIRVIVSTAIRLKRFGLLYPALLLFSKTASAMKNER